MNIQGRQSICHKIAYEVQYKHGYTYLDRCGNMINKIQENAEEWMLPGGEDVSPQNATMVSLRNSAKFNFSSTRYNLIMDQPIGAGKDIDDKDINEFIGQAEFVSSIVNEMLNLKDFVRVGFRIWYLFGSKDKNDSTTWISNLLKEMSIDESITKGFGGTIDAKNYVAVIASHDRKFRMSITGVESNTQLDIGDGLLGIRASQLSKGQDKFLAKQLKERKRILMSPQFAAMIDVDSFVEEPIDVNAKDYILESLKQIQESLPKVFN